ncbi:hypothetical protein [Paludisphaera mucosa]|uniref:Uncharacterized protein n=1 Tax=Paludisphaera mucosa TaxID=3030827 RepID=A0ABT6FBN3_9BACT|nr:hypothetical protein [Paludisphaera mucosa]MDG3004956.1 hypothetical protein [Paludisphaera mucosa]
MQSPPSRLEQASPDGGRPGPFGGEGVWLAPGQGALLRIVDRGGRPLPAGRDSRRNGVNPLRPGAAAE